MGFSNLVNPISIAAATSAVGYWTSSKLTQKAHKMSEKVNSPLEVPQYFKDHKYPAKEHNKRVSDKFVETCKESNVGFLVPGESVEPRKYCDTTKPFRQDRYYYYLSGCDIPGSFTVYLLEQSKLLLFLPDVDEEDVMWSGMPLSLEEAKEQYDVDEVYYVSDFHTMATDPHNVLYKINHFYSTDKDYCETILKQDMQCLRETIIFGDEGFFNSLDSARLIKDEYEIETLRHVAHISDINHMAVMSALPIERNELQVQAEFEYHSMRQGAKSLGYDPICCSGPACGTLHYVKNDQDIENKHSVLIDAGSEWNNYTSDVTRCFPIDGKFTKEHRAIYETVLDMQSTTMKLMRPGASWEKLHLLSHRILINHLLELGIFKKEFPVDEILESRVSCAFYPHGLGHSMGLDVHDVGGQPNYDDKDPLFKYLRIRIPLQAGMVVTNEPGCYFNKFLIEEYINKFPKRAAMVNFDVLEKYMYIGGVRIEDDVLITKEGFENLTGVTSDPDEIEKIVSEGLKKKRSDFHALV